MTGNIKNQIKLITVGPNKSRQTEILLTLIINYFILNSRCMFIRTSHYLLILLNSKQRNTIVD